MKKLLLLTCSLLGLNAFGQNTLLFEISGNGLETPSYLFGTMHVQDEAAFGWNDSVFWAINQADVAAFELDFDAKSLKKSIKPSKSQMKEWETFLVNDLRPSIENAIPADTLGERISSLYVDILKVVLNNDKNKRGTFVDLFLKEYAEKNGKEVVGIESVKEQLNIFLDMDKSLLKKDIMRFVEADDWNVDVAMIMGGQQDMVDAYSTRRLSDVCTYLTQQMEGQSSALTNSLYTRMFNERNAIMMKRVSKMIKKESHFIAVGAGHLCDNSGLVYQLKQAGYTLTPIDIVTKKSEDKVNWVSYSNDNYSVQVPSGVSEIDPADIETKEYMSYISGNVEASYYTTKGKAEFRIELVMNAHESEGYYDYAEEAEGVYDDYETEEVDVEEEATDAVEEAMEDAEAESDEVYEYEAELEQTDAQQEYEYSVEEVEEDYQYDEQPEVVEEHDMADYEYEEEEEVPVDSDYGSDMKRKKSGNSMKDAFENDYWRTVTKAVMGRAMAQMMGEAMKGTGNLTGDEDSIVEQEVVVMGETYKVVSETAYLGYTKTMLVETDNGTYELTISGDPMLLDSGLLDAFFY